MKDLSTYKDFLLDERIEILAYKDSLKLSKGENSKEYKPLYFSKLSSGELNTILFEKDDILILLNSIIDYDSFKLLKKLQVNFIDQTGNMLVNFGEVHISIFHKATKEKLTFKGPSPLKSAGIKFSFSLLKEGPAFLQRTVSECAEIAEISLGATSNMRKMFNDHYLDDFEDLKKSTLINDFSISYNNLLKPKNIVGHYYCENLSDLLDDGAVTISGQHAVQQLSKISVIPRFAHIYIKPELVGKVVLKHKLKKDFHKSNVLICKLPFKLTNKFAPLFLAYADLLDSKDPRDKELALEVFNELLS